MPAQWVATRDVPLASLTRYPGNARRGNLTELRASIRRNGQYRSIVARDDAGELVVLAGNHTADALAAEGHATARCDIITCTDAEARRIVLADNRIAELGGYDDGALAALLENLAGDFDGTGWEPSVLDNLTASTAADLDVLAASLEARGVADLSQPQPHPQPSQLAAPDEDWKVIALRVPPSVSAAWDERVTEADGDMASAFAGLLGLQLVP